MAKLGGDAVLSTFETAWAAATATGQPLASIGNYGLNQSPPSKQDTVPRAVAFVEDAQRVGTTCQAVHWSVTVEIRLYAVGTVELRTAKTALLNWINSGLMNVDALDWTWPSGVTPLLLEILGDGTSKPDRAIARGIVRLRFEVSIEH